MSVALYPPNFPAGNPWYPPPPLTFGPTDPDDIPSERVAAFVDRHDEAARSAAADVVTELVNDIAEDLTAFVCGREPEALSAKLADRLVKGLLEKLDRLAIREGITLE